MFYQINSLTHNRFLVMSTNTCVLRSRTQLTSPCRPQPLDDVTSHPELTNTTPLSHDFSLTKDCQLLAFIIRMKSDTFRVSRRIRVRTHEWAAALTRGFESTLTRPMELSQT